MIQLLESAVKINPKDKNCILFLGFAYQNNRMFEAALKHYKIARSLMSEDESKLFDSINLIMSPQEEMNFNQLASNEKKRFEAS